MRAMEPSPPGAEKLTAKVFATFTGELPENAFTITLGDCCAKAAGRAIQSSNRAFRFNMAAPLSCSEDPKLKRGRVRRVAVVPERDRGAIVHWRVIGVDGGDSDGADVEFEIAI